MEKETCKKCGKVIEGFSKKHVISLMRQHMFKHENEMQEKLNQFPKKHSNKKNIHSEEGEEHEDK